MWTIQAETPQDRDRIEALIDQCFGPGRYAKSAYRLREGVDEVADLSFVAYEDGVLRGSVRFWPVRIGEASALMLGPLAVQPDQRGRGIGVALMEKGIDEARAKGHSLIILVGDEPYYARVGFTRVPTGQIVMPGPVNLDRLLALELVPGSLANANGMILRGPLDHPVAAAATALAAPR
jgi:predicted N-acetyltransferase YhbS